MAERNNPAYAGAGFAPLGRLILGALLIGATLLALVQGYGWLQAQMPKAAQALTAGLVAAGATALGTLPVLLARRFPQWVSDAMLGFGAGVMLAATAFSLITPALRVAREQGAGAWQAGALVGAGILLGGGLLMLVDHLLPHEHFIKGREGRAAHAKRRAWLFIFAITLHNVPEGLAIGVAFAGSDALGAQALSFGIAAQDVPEGLVVALALVGVGYSGWKAAALGSLSGLVEPVAAVLGAALMSISTLLLPWGLASAAGAMLFVISHEIIPESHRRGGERIATTGLLVGFVLMMVLDTALG